MITKIKLLSIAIWMLSLACFVKAGSTGHGDKFKGTYYNNKNGRERKLFRNVSSYATTMAPTLSPQFGSTLSVMITSSNQNDRDDRDDKTEKTNGKIKITSAPTASPTRYYKQKKSKDKSTSAPTVFPTAFPTVSPTRRNKKNKNSESTNIENTSRLVPTVSPSVLPSPSNTNSNSATERPLVSTASPTQPILLEHDTDTENQETTKIPKSSSQISVSIEKESPPPTGGPVSAPEIKPSDDGEVYYDVVTLKSFDIHLTAKEPWHSGFDHLVQRALERYLKTSMFVRDTQLHNVTLAIGSQSYDETTPDASFRFKGHLYVDPIKDIRLDLTTEVWKQQSIALANHLLVQLKLDEDAILATARITLLNVEFPNESAPGSTNSTDEKEERISESGRKALTVIGLIFAFLVAMGIGVWCISPFDGYDECDASQFGKPRESFSQDGTDEILVDHDDIQSVASSLTGAPREGGGEDVESSMDEDNIYLMELVQEPMPIGGRVQMDRKDDDQDSFYSDVQPYFDKTTGPDMFSAPVSNEPSIYSVWKDPQRKRQYESLHQNTSNTITNLTDRRHDESTIATHSIFLTEESATTGSVSLPAAPSLYQTRSPATNPPTSISLSESLRQRIASHLSEQKRIQSNVP